MLAANNVPVSKKTGVAGWITDAEEDLLNKITSLYASPNGVIVGVGVEYGRSSAAIMRTMPVGATYYAVDLFPDDHHYAAQHGGLGKVFLNNMRELDLAPIMLTGFSEDLGKSFYDGPADIIFIDAGHHYKEVGIDIEVWIPHVRAGGVVIFHDYWKDENSHPLHKEVKKAVDEWHEQAQWERVAGPDSIVYFIKPIEAEPEAVDPDVILDEIFDEEAYRADGELMTITELAKSLNYTEGHIKKVIKKNNIASRGKSGQANTYSHGDVLMALSSK